MTSLAFDTRRNQVILRGAGPRRRELWTFDVKTRRWANRQPSGESRGACARPSICRVPFLTYGAGLWEYSPSKNSWQRTTVAEPAPRAGQNRAMVYDAKRDLDLLVLGGGGNEGRASVFALAIGLDGSSLQWSAWVRCGLHATTTY